MSDLSELIQTTKNIEKQNEEIIRLLKKIAGEDEREDKDLAMEDFMKMLMHGNEDEEIPQKEDKMPLDEISKMILKDVDKYPSKQPEPRVYHNVPEPEGTDILNTDHDVGEVCFIEDGEIYKLSVQNNETSIDNLTGSSEPYDFNLQEVVANESIENNQSLSDATVILNKSQLINLPQTLKLCYDEGAKNVFLPWSSIPQLVGAPDVLMQIMNIKYYKTDDELIEILFK